MLWFLTFSLSVPLCYSDVASSNVIYSLEVSGAKTDAPKLTNAAPGPSPVKPKAGCPAPSKASCSYPTDKVGKIFDYCYHIYQAGAGSGIDNKNCGDIEGDIGFVFPRGFNSYYADGMISKIFFAVTEWGDYLKCNHPDGSYVYKCDKDVNNKPPPAGYNKAGCQQAHTPTGDGHWYSFPSAGHDKTWSSVGALTEGAPCQVVRITAKCYFNQVAKAGKCKEGCDGKTADQCARCFEGVSLKTEKQLWKDAFFKKLCPHIPRLEDITFDYNTTGGFEPHLDRNLTWGFWRYPPFTDQLKNKVQSAQVPSPSPWDEPIQEDSGTSDLIV